MELHRQAKVSTRQRTMKAEQKFFDGHSSNSSSCKIDGYITVQGGDTPMSRQQVREEEPAIYSLRENNLVSQKTNLQLAASQPKKGCVFSIWIL